MPLDLTGLDVTGMNSLFPQKPKRNPITAGLSSGVDQLQGLGYNALAAGADALGLNRARDYLIDRALINQDEAYANGRPDLEMVEDQSLGTALPFAAYQIAKQVPQIGAALGIGALTGGAGLVPAGLARAGAALPSVVGGGGLRAGMDFAARRAALQAGQRFGQNLTGGAVLGGAMGVGDMYGESVEAGDPSPYKAFAAAPLYALAEGLPTAVLGGTLAKGAYSGGLGTRMAKAGAINAGAGALSELAQEELVMGFNPNLTPEEITSRRLNAGVIGGLAEGTFGSLGGLRRPPSPTNLLPGANPGVASNIADLNRLPEGAAAGTQGGLFNEEQAPLNQYSPYPPSVNQTAPVAELNGLLAQRGQILTLMQRAEQAGDAKTFYAAQSALNQLAPQIDALQQQVDRATAGDYGGQMSLPLGRPVPGSQMDLFGGYDVLPGQPVAPMVEQPLLQDQQTLDMFEQNPSSLVRTEYGIQQIRAALRAANGGKLNAQLQRFIPEFSRAVEQGPEAVAALIAKYDNNRSTLRPEVFETAAQMAADFQSRMTNSMAAEGLARARPGQRTGSAPQSNATEMEMRAANAVPTPPADVAPVPALGDQIADTDARVQGGQQQRTAAARRDVLDGVLPGAANVGNARNRFIKALRKSGFRDTMITPDEQAAISRYFDATEAFVGQDPDVLPSSPNEMGDVVPEKKERQEPKKAKRTNENKSFSLTSPPSTEEDLAALEKARAKRERKAGTQEEPAPEAEDDRPVRQGELFTKKGEPTAKADQQPEKRKPRKAKVKTTVGEQEVELEVDNVDEKIASMRNDIDKYKAFVACLRKK